MSQNLEEKFKFSTLVCNLNYLSNHNVITESMFPLTLAILMLTDLSVVNVMVGRAQGV